MANKKTNEKKTLNVDLTEKTGTIAFTVAEYHAQIDAICLSEIPMNEKKAQLIELLENKTKATPYREKAIAKIRNFKGDAVKLLTYMYDMMLAGSGNAVVSIA